MCLAVPGKVIELQWPWALVDFGGPTGHVRLDMVPGVRVGNYVLVHAGCAIETLKPLDEPLAAGTREPLAAGAGEPSAAKTVEPLATGSGEALVADSAEPSEDMRLSGGGR